MSYRVVGDWDGVRDVCSGALPDEPAAVAWAEAHGEQLPDAVLEVWTVAECRAAGLV